MSGLSQALACLALATLVGCGGSGGADASPPGSAAPGTPDTQAVVEEVSDGETRLMASRDSPTSFQVVRIFPNDARYELAVSHRAASMPNVSPDTVHVIGRKLQVESSQVERHTQFFVPFTAMPQGMRSALSLPAAAAGRVQRSALAQDPQPSDGVTFHVKEVVKEGSKTGFAETLQYLEKKQTKIPAKAVSGLFQAASSLAEVDGALLVAEKYRAWLAALDALEQCAANPRDRLSQTDPGYSERTVRMIREARTELKTNGAVRFLSMEADGMLGLLKGPGAVVSFLTRPIVNWSNSANEEVSGRLVEEMQLAVRDCEPEWVGSVQLTERNNEGSTVLTAEISITFKQVLNNPLMYEVEEGTAEVTFRNWKGNCADVYAGTVIYAPASGNLFFGSAVPPLPGAPTGSDAYHFFFGGPVPPEKTRLVSTSCIYEAPAAPPPHTSSMGAGTLGVGRLDPGGESFSGSRQDRTHAGTGNTTAAQWSFRARWDN